MVFLLYLISYHSSLILQYPEMQERARGEISNIISDVENLNREELNDLLYTDAFIKESLRLFVPTPQNMRVATKDCKLGNVSIPKRTSLLISHVYIHKNEFEKGDEFIPERWLNGMICFCITVVLTKISEYPNITTFL